MMETENIVSRSRAMKSVDYSQVSRWTMQGCQCGRETTPFQESRLSSFPFSGRSGEATTSLSSRHAKTKCEVKHDVRRRLYVP